MAKEKYRLQALLTIRGREKKRSEVALAIAIKELNEAREKEEELEKEKEEIIENWKISRQKMKEEIGIGSMILDGNVHNNYLKKLKEDEKDKEKEIEEQHEVVVEAEESVATARRDYIEASKQLQIMEKHKGLWTKKVKKILSKKEEKELNELGNALHQLKSWRGDGAGM